MALRLGIGDMFTICKGAVDLCRSLHDEPKEVQSVVAEMKSMKVHLKALESKIGDERSFGTARPDIASIIKRSLEPLHRDLQDIKNTLKDCTHRPSVHVVDKVRYLVLYKAKLEGFRDKLPAHRTSISMIQKLIDCQSPSDRRASTIELSSFIENQEKQQKRQDDYDRAQMEVLKMFEEQLPSPEKFRHFSTSDILERLEVDLIGKGTLPEEVEEQLRPITEALLPQFLSANPDRAESQTPGFKLDIFEPISDSAAAISLDRRKSER